MGGGSKPALYFTIAIVCMCMQLYVLTCHSDFAGKSIYRIAGNFRGLYISRIAIKFIFAETNFVDCMIKATPTQVLLAAVYEVYDLDTASTRACGLGSL